MTLERLVLGLGGVFMIVAMLLSVSLYSATRVRERQPVAETQITVIARYQLLSSTEPRNMCLFELSNREFVEADCLDFSVGEVL